MSRIIFDIETMGQEFDSLDESVQSYLLKWAESEDDIKRVKESVSFYPVTGEIIAIGMLNPDTDKGAVYYQSRATEPPLPVEEEGIRYEAGTEKDILEKFWLTVKPYDHFVTYNGRGFDCPFILIRSALHGIRPTRALMPYRYGDVHIDLMDQLCFYGATRRFSLDMWCNLFGVKSPKSEMTGYDVPDVFREGRYMDIARYCAGDLWATKEILLRWEKYVKPGT